MVPSLEEGFKQPALDPSKTLIAPSSKSRSPIAQLLQQRVPRDSDPGPTTIRLLLGDSSLNGPESEDNTPVEAYDADPEEGIIGLPSIVDYSLWTKAAAQFIRSNSGLEDSGSVWVGKRPLGQGGFGMAGLWEKYDRNGNIVDQLVVKQTGRGKKASSSWRPDVPNEVKIMREMNKTGCPSVVKLRGYRRYPHQQVHRIYMEFCPHGDLRKLCKRYRRFRRHFPEPFLWEMFYHMVEAASAMLNGPKQPNARGYPPWTHEIVHRDIKPGNIFLGDENPNGLAFYPTPKLGDFGLAVKTNLADTTNPGGLRGAGTPKYMPPEQLKYKDLPDHLRQTNTPLCWYTNIWAIGASMFELITLHPLHHFLLPGPGNNNEGIPEIQTSRDPDYSIELRELVRKCLRPVPASRPCIPELLRRINLARKALRRYSHTIYSTDNSTPHPELERVFYRGNEIDQMQPGGWEPSRTAAAMDPNRPESGFRNPSEGTIHYPRWPPVRTTEDAEGDTDDSSITTRAERKVMAGGDVQGGNDEEEEEAEEDDEDDGLDPESETLEEEYDYDDEDEDVIMGGTNEYEETKTRTKTAPKLTYEAKDPINRFGRRRMI